MNRREFLATTAFAGAAAAAPAKDQISLAAWSINRSFFLHHRWKNTDLPAICRKEFGIGAWSSSTGFFENPVIGLPQPVEARRPRPERGLRPHYGRRGREHGRAG